MRTFAVKPFGCQMNKHDAERVVGLLRASGLDPVAEGETPDLVVFLTCCVREGAEERLRGTVSSLRPVGAREPMIAVGGCIGQRDGERLLRALPTVDVVFGTHNIAHLPSLVEAAERSGRPQVEVVDEGTDFASDLPSEREHRWHAWVPITVGCDNFCTYCIVPYVRGRERSRTLDDIVAEAKRLVSDGVLEVTLLGQNVNSYGRDLYGEPRFAEVLRAVADTGVRRIRFATSHPKDLSEGTIAAMAEVEAVMPYLHLPLQAGSDRVLAAMNRVYTRDQYLDLVGRLRAAIPDLALSTDIIVGFPGETEDDFECTLDVVREAGFDHAFTFIYSPRTGTPAAGLPDQVPRPVAQARFDRLTELVRASALERNLRLVGSDQELLIEGPSKRDADVLTGRTAGNKLAHVPLPRGADAGTLAGTFAVARIEAAQTWFLTGTLAGTNSV